MRQDRPSVNSLTRAGSKKHLNSPHGSLRLVTLSFELGAGTLEAQLNRAVLALVVQADCAFRSS